MGGGRRDETVQGKGTGTGEAGNHQQQANARVSHRAPQWEKETFQILNSVGRRQLARLGEGELGRWVRGNDESGGLEQCTFSMH